MGEFQLYVAKPVSFNGRIAHSEFDLSIGNAAGGEANLSARFKMQQSGHIFVLG